MGLVRVTSAADGKHEFLNPDHVRSVREIPGGTQIIFSDGAALIVKESLDVVIAAIQGPKS
jgi:uncharacterized protein YlzI (FlbEa/FlbD family)